MSDCCHEHVGLSPSQRTLRAVFIKIPSRRRPAMEVMFDRVAGLDIGKASVTVCVRTLARRDVESQRQARSGR